METLPADLLLAAIPAAGSWVTENGIILAANERMASLTGLSRTPTDANSLIGRSITTLPIALIPATRSVVLRNWKSVFEAAKLRLDPTYSYDDVLESKSRINESLDSNTGVDPETASFWEREDHKELALLDVLIQLQGNGSNGWSLGSRKQIRARMCVRAVRWNSQLRFAITFRRPLSTRESSLDTPVIADTELPSMFMSDIDSSDRAKEIQQVVSGLIPSSIGVTDADGQVLYLTQSWYDFTGMSREETLGSGWATALHPDDVVALTVAWADAVSTQRDHWTYEARYRKKDGTYCYFIIRAQSTKDEYGKVQKWYASILDVNELVLARLDSDLRRQAIVTLLSKADVSLWGINQSCQLYMREGALPWDPSMSTGMRENDNDNSYMTEQQQPKDVKANIEDLLHGLPFQPFIEHQEQDRFYRTRFIADTEHGRISEEGRHSVSAALGLTIDVTDVKARARLQVDNERLASKSRAASEASELKSRFLANMTHELRNPLGGILGLNEILSGTDLDEEQKELCEDTKHTATFLLTLINDILDFSKIEAGHMDIEAVPFNPSTVVDNVNKLMVFGAREKNLALICENQLPREMCLVGDGNRLQQILTNLLSNAIKFTDVGKVCLVAEILTGVDPPEDKEASHASMVIDSPNVQDNVVVQFSVVDTGCGIDEATLSRLFRPFSQADSSTSRTHGGTGLGLTISQELAGLMGGKIKLTSVPSKGSTAVVTIPFQAFHRKLSMCTEEVTSTSLSPPTPTDSIDSLNLSSNNPRGRAAGISKVVSHTGVKRKRPQPSGRVFSNETRSRTHILVVEDNQINQKIALLNLKRLGFHATAVWNGQEAVDYIDGIKDASRLPAVILLDLMLPILDGYQATKMLKLRAKAVSSIPIIAMTASGTKGDRERCQEAGFSDYLLKPVVRDDLEKMLLKWLRPKK